MDVFELRNTLVGDYAEYTRSFIKIRDRRIADLVEENLKAGRFWPEALLQLNPAYQPGGFVTDLIQRGLLHPLCDQVFRFEKKEGDPDSGIPVRLHEHQRLAIEKAAEGASYVLTSGTGSGKSLTYIVPIVDHVLRNGSGNGIQAIVVYPMNALANSQFEELGKFLSQGFPKGQEPVRFARYTGQEREEERRAIRENAPDILLTNYVMLELLLTRTEDEEIVRKAKGLRFLVFDELHTYRGRQGADVAMLIRRCKEALRAPNCLCIGTSATMSSDGNSEQQKDAVADVAHKLFGIPFSRDQVIGEVLSRTTAACDFTEPSVREALRRSVSGREEPPDDPQDFVGHPLSSWIESAFGLREEEGTGALVRRAPRRLVGPDMDGEESAGAELARLTGESEEDCADAIRRFLMKGAQLRLPGQRLPIFAFRLHQFFSRGDTVWATLEPPEERYLDISKTAAKPGEPDKLMYPLVFCRLCGQEYYRVRQVTENGTVRFVPREGPRGTDDDGEDGFLYLSTEEPFPTPGDPDYALRLAAGQTELDSTGALRPKKGSRSSLPQSVEVAPDGCQVQGGLSATFLRRNLRQCLNPSCAAEHSPSIRSETIKLGTLGMDSRSTATTILAMRALLELRQDSSLDFKARKLLSFTDNRQDASLQAGHFNDFIQVTLLRSALYDALAAAGQAGLGHAELASKVFESLGLPFDEYASQPGVLGPRRVRTENCLKNVLEYYLYRDLRRGWRLTAPNLEETGLLRFDHEGLAQLVEDDRLWIEGLPADGPAGEQLEAPSALQPLAPAVRRELCETLLDLARRGLAIKAGVLDRRQQPRLVSDVRAQILEDCLWYLQDEREMEEATVLRPRPGREGERGFFVSSHGNFGKYLSARLRGLGVVPSEGEVDRIIRFLVEALCRFGILEQVVGQRDGDHGYQINPACMIWLHGDGSAASIDRTRLLAYDGPTVEPNPYFKRLYEEFGPLVRALRNRAKESEDSSGPNVLLEAREHTAQVGAEDRQQREEQFRSGRLPLLFCSPTMELGVDIAELNVVNLRNVPPTPANYAQRSGRAGRGGQPALVYSYCAGRSPHDQYYFRHPNRMVAGAVAPPRIDLTNQDLLRAHVHAIWLEVSQLDLGKTLCDVLDVDTASSQAKLPLRQNVLDRVKDGAIRSRASGRAKRVLQSVEPALKQTSWYTDQWVDTVLSQVEQSLDAACDRWRQLYWAAVRQRDYHHKRCSDRSLTKDERELSARLRAQAERQIDLLTQESKIGESDFYVYRYLATEGFLPGYNFPRLPVAAYVPGRRRARSGGEDSYLSRPRFLAISEFGPQALVYHEGARYQVYKVNFGLDAGGRDGARVLPTEELKRCEECGYAHPLDPVSPKNACERCGVPLNPSTRIDNLVKMVSVSLRLRDRITCDEEERQRLGYHILTAYRFPTRAGQSDRRDAEVLLQGSRLARISYADATDLYRINLGWTLESKGKSFGFDLDVDRGQWVGSRGVPEDAGPKGARVQRVVPYVRDTRNALVIRFEPTPSETQMASLASAIWQAILQRFQLEPREISYEPLPSLDQRRELLFYEASEGGAGVLRQVVEDPRLMPELARIALELCHFDPVSLADLAADRCGKACYECLLDYSNQPDHLLMDRHSIAERLRDLSCATVKPAGGRGTRDQRLAALESLCESELEKEWLRRLDSLRLRLPDAAQKELPNLYTRPDFWYDKPRTAVYIDGPPHDDPRQKAKDDEITERLLDLGYIVIRFPEREDWEAIFAVHPDVFGEPQP